MTELTITLGYSAGQLDVRLEGDSYPDDWSTEREMSIMSDVENQLYDIDDIHTWRTNFETAQEYSPPGMSPEPEVGTVSVTDDEYTVDLEIESAADCDGF